MSSSQQSGSPSTSSKISGTQANKLSQDVIEIPQYLHANIINQDPYICCSCKRLLTHPMKYQPCQHLVCNECAITYTDSCQQCQNLVISVDDDEIVLKNILAQQVKCECGAIMDLKDYIQKHLPSCEQALIACPNGCNQCFTHQQKQMHLQQECPKRMVSCQHCGAIISFDESQEHMQHCLSVKINCQHCNQLIFRSDLQPHLQMCPQLEIQCPLCKISIKRGQLEQHFGDLQAVGHHIYSLYQQFNNMATRIQIRYEELTQEIRGIEQKLTQIVFQKGHNSFIKSQGSGKSYRSQNQLQTGGSICSDSSLNGQTQQELDEVVMDKKPNNVNNRVIRTSLRILPGQQAGTERISSYMLILPDEVYANNDYRVNSVPPTQSSYLEITNSLTGQMQIIEPTVKSNQIYYRISLPQGQYSVSMKDKQTNEEQDQQDLTVLQQTFSNGLSQVTQRFQYQTPMRHFFNVTKQNKQTFLLKVLFCNCFLGIGSGNDNDRTVDDFKMICDDGVLVSRQDGKIQKTQTEVHFKEGDTIEIAVNQQQENVQVTCREKSLSLYFPRDWNLYLELVDTSVVLL